MDGACPTHDFGHLPGRSDCLAGGCEQVVVNDEHVDGDCANEPLLSFRGELGPELRGDFQGRYLVSSVEAVSKISRGHGSLAISAEAFMLVVRAVRDI